MSAKHAARACRGSEMHSGCDMHFFSFFLTWSNGFSSSKPDYYSHSGPQGAEGGHHEEVGLGLAETRLIAFFHTNMKIVGHGHPLVMLMGAGVSLGRYLGKVLNLVRPYLR
jgi:hypothetical protein